MKLLNICHHTGGGGDGGAGGGIFFFFGFFSFGFLGDRLVNFLLKQVL